MSWLQLADYIRAMSHEEKLQPVRFAESYKGGRTPEVRFQRSDYDFILGEGDDQTTVRKGEPYLW